MQKEKKKTHIHFALEDKKVGLVDSRTLWLGEMVCWLAYTVMKWDLLHCDRITNSTTAPSRLLLVRAAFLMKVPALLINI